MAKAKETPSNRNGVQIHSAPSRTRYLGNSYDVVGVGRLCARLASSLFSGFSNTRRALEEIRQQPGCRNVKDIAINRVSDQHAEYNWSLCVSSAGTADANTAARAALYVQGILRRDYNLMTD